MVRKSYLTSPFNEYEGFDETFFWTTAGFAGC